MSRIQTAMSRIQTAVPKGNIGQSSPVIRSTFRRPESRAWEYQSSWAPVDLPAEKCKGILIPLIDVTTCRATRYYWSMTMWHSAVRFILTSK